MCLFWYLFFRIKARFFAGGSLTHTCRHSLKLCTDTMELKGGLTPPFIGFLTSEVLKDISYRNMCSVLFTWYKLNIFYFCEYESVIKKSLCSVILSEKWQDFLLSLCEFLYTSIYLARNKRERFSDFAGGVTPPHPLFFFSIVSVYCF